MDTLSPKITSICLIIVNYNAGRLLSKSLLQIEKSRNELVHLGIQLNAVLVDNKSIDDSYELLKSLLHARGIESWCNLTQNSVNGGFASGNNFAVSRARQLGWADGLLFFLNPDAELLDNTIREVLNFYGSLPSASLVGCTQINRDMKVKPSAFRYPSILTEFQRGANIGIFEKLFKSSKIVIDADRCPKRVDWVTGAAFAMPAFIYLQVGEMDEDFFLYFEEVEFMRRVTMAGYPVWTLPLAQVIHEGGASTGVKKGRLLSGDVPAYWYDSWLLYFQKTRGTLYRIIAAAAYLAGTLLNSFFAMFLSTRRSEGFRSMKTFVRRCLLVSGSNG